jgi:hypothetical protein
MSEEVKWGVGLRGHGFDLKDWEESLRAPFDPWVERLNEEYVLRSSAFDGLASSDVVQARAQALVDQLNGAMAASNGTRQISLGSFIRFDPDGTHHFYIPVEPGRFEVRGRLSADAMVLRRDGTVAPDDKIAQPSEVQRWANISVSNDHLAVYISVAAAGLTCTRRSKRRGSGGRGTATKGDRLDRPART